MGQEVAWRSKGKRVKRNEKKEKVDVKVNKKKEIVLELVGFKRKKRVIWQKEEFKNSWTCSGPHSMPLV
jgi:hypothetical protein